ncbi:B3/4 domain-containing protein [Plantibacter sp. M259]|uniref:B3/B4 domain-containing protein n=1 Tax=Plantibacter sp. M259 TaxID=2583822 RepID=UPI001110D19E|nr:phenylalanine--tRNA ligase beta subunit-related protein [Plantibacter sp. M259]
MNAIENDRTWFDGAMVDEAVFALRPDYRAFLVLADGLVPGPSDEASEALLLSAERRITQRLEGGKPEELPEIAAWREAYRSFGAKPQRTRPSVEALVRRIDDGLPRIDRITDTYNAISVGHLLPLGGENADAYIGPARLVRADGTEDFEVSAAGELTVEHPEVGEVVWRDDQGVTCRRWNWRQPPRTRITLDTTRAFFIIDALLDATPGVVVDEAAQELQTALAAFSPDATFTTRLLGPTA